MDKQTLEHKALILERIRTFFKAREVLEITTPCIVNCPVSDVHIESVRLNTEGSHFLRTSPESAHKWLLAHGLGDIYELGPVFRGHEHGRFHQPEFLLLEWYRQGFSWKTLAAEVIELIRAMAEGFKKAPCAVYRSWAETTQTHLGCVLDEADPEALQACVAKYVDDPVQCADWSREEIIDFLYATGVQTQFDPDMITVVYNYPAEQSALAQLTSDGRWARRFEVFIGTVEVANGYQELTDHREQLDRFKRDAHTRAMMNRPVEALDQQLLQALERGLPDCAGVAMGVERVIMSLLDLDELSQTMAISQDKAV